MIEALAVATMLVFAAWLVKDMAGVPCQIPPRVWLVRKGQDSE